MVVRADLVVRCHRHGFRLAFVHHRQVHLNVRPVPLTPDTGHPDVVEGDPKPHIPKMPNDPRLGLTSAAYVRPEESVVCGGNCPHWPPDDDHDDEDQEEVAARQTRASAVARTDAHGPDSRGHTAGRDTCVLSTYR